VEVKSSRAFSVEESTQTGEARRAAMTFARDLGFDEVEAGRVGIVVTEAATNMVKHASGGRVVVQELAIGSHRGVCALALDRGPGVADLPDRMRDGFSTQGSSGTGLGAIARQSQAFDVYSSPGKGTAVFSAMWPRDGAPRMPGIAVGGVSVPKPGEEVCGDAWASELRDGRLLLAVCDGLGHGPLAEEAARTAIGIVESHSGAPLEELASRAHDALRPTRGAAIALVEIGPGGSTLRYCGIGNIVGRIFSDEGERRLISHFGTLGHDVHKIRVYEYAWPPGATLVLHSDGLTERWSLGDYPGLARREPTLVAGVLYRDHSRQRDDCTVVVARRAA
jgi:anti-sigma regulatory factor (Ser/Thr protein kinase)